MAKIETKFGIGDAVYSAHTVHERKRHDCPDCLESGKWKAISPAGDEYEFSCPRCKSTYISDSDLCLDYTVHGPSVRPLTIGSVRHDSYNSDHKTTYMCQETGVGSGSVHYESDLFHTHDEAMEAAKAKAALRNADADSWEVKRYNKTLELCDYQLKDAQVRSAEGEATLTKYKLHDLITNIKECATMSDVREVIEALQADSEAA